MNHFSSEQLADFCKEYREEGYVTFDSLLFNRTAALEAPNRAPTGSSFLEAVVGVSLEDARSHLDDCVLYGRYDINADGRDVSVFVKPTKTPPPAYIAELVPFLEEQKRLAELCEEIPSEGVKLRKTPKPKKALQHQGRPRRTVHSVDVHLCDTVFRQIATSPAIGELVAAFTGWAELGVGVRLLETQVWMKPPHCTIPLAFHRDTPYFGFLSPLDVCTVWFTFDDVSTLEKAKTLGGLEYAKGSHLWSQAGGIEGVFFDKDYRAPMKKAALEHMMLNSDVPVCSIAESPQAKKIRTEEGRGSELTEASTSAICAETHYSIHYVVAPAGGVSFHNGMLWHGSGANLSTTEWRRGIGIHYIRSDAQFKPEFAVYDDKLADHKEDVTASADTTPAVKRPFLSNMWAPHKQRGTLSLNDERFPIIWPAQTI